MLTLLCCQIVLARSHSGVVLEGAQSFTTFRFISNNAADNHGFTRKSDREFSLGYLYDWKYGIILGGDIGLYYGGADEVLGNEDYSWELKYIRTKISVGYLLHKWRIKPFVSVSLYYGYLLRATESIGCEEYDLSKDDKIRNWDFGLVTTGGVKVPLSHTFQVFGAYNQNFGLLNIETHTGQRLYNRGFSFSLGVIINLPGKK